MVPESMSWEGAKALAPIGENVVCVVREHHPFGVIVSLSESRLHGVIERIRMAADGYRTPEEYPAIGSIINAIVIGFRDYSQQVELAMPKKSIETIHESQFGNPIEVGLRVGDCGRLEFFGINDVNNRIASGEVVARIEKGRAIMLKAGESQDGVKMQLRGFSVLVVLSGTPVG